MQKRLLLTALLFSFQLFSRANDTGIQTHQDSATECDHVSHSAVAAKDPFEGLDSFQQRLLNNLADQHQQKYALALCFAPGTPEETIAERYASIPAAYRIQPTFPRWTATATDGGSIPRGVPLTVRWSFVADGVNLPGSGGEAAAPSNLKAFLNGIYGNQATWQPLFQQVFDRWSELSGVNYVYEANDDGALFPDSQGVIGVRGDVRIGGHLIDGNSGTLAYNFYPTTGDMVIDTGDNFYSDTSNGSIRLRNVLAHEAGHGLGFEHVCPVNQTKLMEPFAAVNFNGPQHDDFLAVHRNYGDNYGQIGTTATAYNLGTFGNQTTSLTNLSIDGAGEVDLFKFSLTSPSKWASVTLTPIGFTYLEGIQSGGSCTAGTSTNSKTVVNLSLQILDSNGTTVLGSANLNPAGQSETLTNILLSGTGPYYIRVAGDSVDNVQLYDFNLHLANAALAVPVIVAEPATTPGTSNTISWSAIQAVSEAAQTATESSSKIISVGMPTRILVDSSNASRTTIAPKIVRPGTQPLLPIVRHSQKDPFQPAPLYQNILTEDFEVTFPQGWDLYAASETSPTWLYDDSDAHTGIWSGWCAGTSGLPSSQGYQNNMFSWMVYGPFSLQDATNARVKFWYKNDSEPGRDFLKWRVSTDDDSYYGTGETSGEQLTWKEEVFDLTNVPGLGNLTGQSQVWIAFIFESDGANSGAQGYTGAFLDDIVIEKDYPTEPDLTNYLPANWNDKIPIGTSQLGPNDAHTYSGVFYDNQALYFNWASANQGDSAAGSYTVRAEVTGTGGGVWSWIVTNHPVSQWFASTLDQAVGPLAAGSHTFKVWVDYNNTVSESSEANNYYERTINVTTMVPIEYYAERASNSSFTSPTGSGWISGTQYTFQGLTTGQTYWYRVKARQGANESAWSTSVSSQQVADSPVLSVGPSSQNFGTIQVGLTVDRTFSVTNSGAGTLSGSASVSAPFSVFSGGSYNLTAGQTQSVIIRYTPVAAGTHNANVTFTGGAGATTQVSGVATNANTPPTVTITLPTSNSTYSTNQNTISLGGIASDNLAVTSVSWSNDRGGSGSATGTTTWSVPAITLQPGTNLLTVTAQDASLATGSDSLSVVFIPPNVFRTMVKTNGHFQFTLEGEVGRTYVVQYSSNLVSWPTLVTLTNTTGTMTHTDPNATNGARFYRSFPQ